MSLIQPHNSPHIQFIKSLYSSCSFFLFFLNGKMSFELDLIFLAITKMLGDVAEKMGVGGEWLERMKLYWFWHLHLVHECTLYFPSAGFCTAELCILWFPWAACMGKKKVFKRKQSNKAINKHRKPWGTAEQLINSNNEGDCTNRKKNHWQSLRH